MIVFFFIFIKIYYHFDIEMATDLGIRYMQEQGIFLEKECKKYSLYAIMKCIDIKIVKGAVNGNVVL